MQWLTLSSMEKRLLGLTTFQLDQSCSGRQLSFALRRQQMAMHVTIPGQLRPLWLTSEHIIQQQQALEKMSSCEGHMYDSIHQNTSAWMLCSPC